MTDRFKKRFDGLAAWAQLDPEQKNAIGATALEIVVNWNGQDAYESHEQSRPFHAADPMLLDMLHSFVADILPEVIEADPLPVPSMLGQVCRRCGCSEHDACVEICAWAEDDLCTSCAGGEES